MNEKNQQQNPLAEYGRNLNQEVIDQKIDPIIGRDQEIRRLIEILSRKSKNNPVLIGEPGVGKTAVVEGFVQRIVAKDVPTNLLDKQVYELSLSSLISGASMQGEFEARLNAIIKYVKNSNNQIILFIDEIHQLVGAGRTSGAMDAANILKPIMARGDFKIIGATTLNEYRNYIEKDGALERRMQKVMVNEPTKTETYTIMRGLKHRWELFHGVKITDAAIVAATDLSARYITDRNLPDKAIDLIDEAAAKIKTEMHSQPKLLDELNRNIIHLETERAALMQEQSPKTTKRLDAVELELSKLKDQQATLQASWNLEKQQHQQLLKLKNQISNTQALIEKYQSEAKFEAASKLLYVKLPELNQELQTLEAKLVNESVLVKDKVTAEEVANVISESLKIPLNKIVASEKSKLLQLKPLLLSKIIGQDNAIEALNNAVLRNRIGINDPNKPIGSFLFVGPTGVGKTEVAKCLAESLFDDQNQLIRIDMSEFLDKHAITKLIGVAPGYVGYEQAGTLTDAVRNKPYAVVLFDEIEKAHPEVLDLLLQILDYGKLVDGKGRTINFKNTIIIMSSNVGSEQLLKQGAQVNLNEILLQKFRMEFLNRMDEIVVFHPLKLATLNKITNKFLLELADRLSEKEYVINFDKNVIKAVLDQSYDEKYGARPLKRFIQKHIESVIATAIIQDKLLVNQPKTLTWNNKLKQFELVNPKSLLA